MPTPHTQDGQILTILDHGRLEQLDYEGLLRFHQGNATWGASVAFRALQRAGIYLSKVAPWERRTLTITSAHPGPGVRDAVEYVTRCVSQGRYRLTQPEQDGQCHKDMHFAWWVDDGTRTISVTLREGFVPEEFFDLLDRIETPREQPGDRERLRQLKVELTKQLWGESLDNLFRVTETTHRSEGTNSLCTN